MAKKKDAKKDTTIPEIIDSMQERRPYHFWDNHPKLNNAKAFVLCTIGAAMIAFVINSFVSTAGLFPGGFAGLTLLITRSADKFLGITIPYSLVYIPLNAVPIMIGIRHLGKRFTGLSVYVIVLSSILVDLLPQYAMTYDVLLLSVFGGLIDGAAVSLCLYVGACGGGTDFISIFMSQKKGSDTFNIILLINTIILITAGLIFGWDKALYSILFQYASTEVIHVLYKRYQKQTMLIVTDKPQEISQKIYDVAHHGTTIIKAQGGYTGEDRYLIYSVVSSDEVKKVMEIVDEAGGTAFVNAIRTEDFLGNFYHRPNT